MCSAVIRGLKGLTFVDKTDGMKEKVEERDEVRITGFTDRLYQSAPDEVTLRGLEGGRCLKLTKVRDEKRDCLATWPNFVTHFIYRVRGKFRASIAVTVCHTVNTGVAWSLTS